MDFVECEAPLDSSFQKDRLELVNKGSLGRRRKPSRSNLRFILSPANDRRGGRQEIQESHPPKKTQESAILCHRFNNSEPIRSEDRENSRYIDPESRSARGKYEPIDPLEESALDNRQESTTLHQRCTDCKQGNKNNFHLSSHRNNERDENAESRIFLYSDLNGNSHRSILTSRSHQNGHGTIGTSEKRNSASRHSITNGLPDPIGTSENQLNGNCPSRQPAVTSGKHQDFIAGKDDGIVQKDQQKAKSENSNLKNRQNIDSKNYLTELNTIHRAITHRPVGSTHSGTVNVRSKQLYQKTVESNNHHNKITFSNHRQTLTSSPTEKAALTNGRLQEGTSRRNSSPRLCIESSLSRTSKETDLVAEARQFSIEAKLKRQKSEVQGRSAVLIQTWERRTQSESCSKLKRESVQNRLGKTEFEDAHSTAMPDSYICIKYKGSLQKGDHFLEGDSVLDSNTDERMLYRITDNRRRSAELGGTAARGSRKSSAEEPEWISLSRKLCAKFVEGHIEAHSPDSYQREEPEGATEEPISSFKSNKTHSGASTAIQEEVKKRKVIPTAPSEETTPTSDEPPWIHLSRKLCTKFIEEHIEYPPLTNDGHLTEIRDLVEPNGDVRIIEKVGKPKGHRSKQKKDCEPEWISLSKKLRAKFIESHIDDPDTIALDNQLNASDHEEAGSETLSDISQETTISKEMPKAAERKNSNVKNEAEENKEVIQDGDKSLVFPEKECCWEYQEMEFDQESISGNFQEVEFFDPSPGDRNSGIQREPLSREMAIQLEERMVLENARSQENPECFNNDVKFAPRFTEEESYSDCAQQNKLITVQFIAHSGKDAHRDYEETKEFSNTDIKSDSFFNLSMWEDSQDENYQQTPDGASLCKDFRSKSLDNLCDSLDEKDLVNEIKKINKNSKRDSQPATDALFSEEKYVSKSRELPNKNTYVHEFKLDPEVSSNISLTEESCNCLKESEPSRGKNRFAFYEKHRRNNYNEALSSEDEVFGHHDLRNTNSHSNSPVAEHYGTPSTKKNRQINQKHKDETEKNSKHNKCNGMIPNSIYDSFPDGVKSSGKSDENINGVHNNSAGESKKLGMSKWITMSKSEQNKSKPEYSNILSAIQKEQQYNRTKSSDFVRDSRAKVKNINKDSAINEVNPAFDTSKENAISKYANNENAHRERNEESMNGDFKKLDMKVKCKSLCDISYIHKPLHSDGDFRQHESVADLSLAKDKPNRPKIEFQHFNFNSEIPLCAKLVSNHDRKNISKNASVLSAAKRTESPSLSESSHVYEDMFKETSSAPSDSEASSWTAVKNRSYYVNGRSSSMNDLDFSDSCSLSVKCDYASSSENSTLQSRHSSYTSSSFYVNLRDYDSHMLEPSLNKGKKRSDRRTSNGVTSHFSKSNPPTPESLRHLFTSPLSSVHTPQNLTSGLYRMPSDPQPHYYSTAAATSTAFKHGFALDPPKPKKTERSPSIKIKDIAQGIILTFKKLQNNSKNSSLASTQQVDVSHLAEMKSNSEFGRTKKGHKESKKQNQVKARRTEIGRTDSDSGFVSDAQRAKARRSSSDLTGLKSNADLFHSDRKKGKNSKKGSSRDKGKKSKRKTSDPRTVPTVSRKVQQMADGTLYLVTTVSGDTTLPGVYSDSPDNSSELSSHRSIQLPEESNC